MDTGLMLWASTTISAAVVLDIIWKIVLVILGINALIIVHEFGHFLVARWCGVRCEKFYIWFDIYGWKICKFKWGDTEFGIGVLPLGGYVKMFGQEDNPGAIAKELERVRLAQEAAENASAEQSAEKPLDVEVVDGEPKPATGEDSQQPELTPEQVKALEEAMYAKDSYLSKSVPQRMAIIVAGVVMNMIFAVFCATVAYLIGVQDRPAYVGNVSPGSPAWAAGLQTGDKIVKIDGKDILVFTDISQSALSGGNPVNVEIERPLSDGSGSFETIEKTLIPQMREGDLNPTIGVVNASTLELNPEIQVYPTFDKIYSAETKENLAQAQKLMKMNDIEVVSLRDKQLLAQRFIDQPIKFVFSKRESLDSLVEVELPPNPMLELGIRFQIGEIMTVKPDTDAFAKGVVPGDVILEVDGDGNFDPFKLPQELRKRADAGSTHVPVRIRKQDGTVQDLELALIKDAQASSYTGASRIDPVGCEALGLAYGVTNVVANHTKIPAGAKVTAITILDKESNKGFTRTQFIHKTSEGVMFTDINDKIDISVLCCYYFQNFKHDTSFRISYENEGKTVNETVVLKPASDWFSPERGLVFQERLTIVKYDSITEATSKGFFKTLDYATLVFKTLRKLGSEVSAKALGGPVTIVTVAYNQTSNGFGAYLMFLCLIGANLAVINILPIPVLDGGHVVFLAYEGITGRPPNENVQIILSYIGLFLLLGLMLWVFALDLGIVTRH